MADFLDPIASGQKQGEGWAQVFTPYKDEVGAKQIESAQAAIKEQSTATKGVMKSLAGLQDIDILPGDQTRFADMQKDIYDYTAKNIDSLRSGDPMATIEFQKKLTEYSNNANHSKAWKKLVNDSGKEIATKPDKYSPESRTGWLSVSESSFDPEGKPKSWDFGFMAPAEQTFDPANFYPSLFRKWKPDKQEVTTRDLRSGRPIIEKNENYGRYDLMAMDVLDNPVRNKYYQDKLNGLSQDEYRDLETRAEDEGLDPLTKFTMDELESRSPKSQTIRPLSQPRAAGTKRGGGVAGGDKEVTINPVKGSLTHSLRQVTYDPSTNQPMTDDEGNVQYGDKPKTETLSGLNVYKFPRNIIVIPNASRFYDANPTYKNEAGVEDASRAGSWVTRQINEPVKMGAVIEAPFDTKTDRMLSPSEYKNKKYDNKYTKETPNIEMKLVVPFYQADKLTGYLDYSEEPVQEAIRNKGFELNIQGGQAAPTGTDKSKKYNIKGTDYSYDQVSKAAQQSGMTIDEYVKELNNLQ